jgi:hypothetical protein
MAYLAIGMAMPSEGSYENVLSQLTDGLAWSSGWAENYSPPSNVGDPRPVSGWVRSR